MSLCILTNTAAIFPPVPSADGRFVRTLTLNTRDWLVIPPQSDDFSRAYRELEREFNAIFVLTASEALLPGTEAARLAAQNHGGMTNISVLDSRQIGPGLGILAQIGAQQAAAGASLLQVEESIWSTIPHLYTLICPDATTAPQNGQNYPWPVPASELSNALPVFSLEEGQLIPYKNIRTRRHLMETLQEFLQEFENPQQIVYFHGRDNNLRARPLREAASGLFPGIPFAELELSIPLKALFGAQTVGVTVLEMPQ